MPLSLGRPLRAIFGRFRGGSPAPLIDEAARRAALLDKGKLIAARAEVRIQARAAKALEQARFDEAMGAKATAIKGAIKEFGVVKDIRTTRKNGKVTLSFAQHANYNRPLDVVQKDAADLAKRFGLTPKNIKKNGKTVRTQLSFTDPAMPSAWVPPSQRKTARVNSTIGGTTASSPTATASRLNANGTRRIKGRTMMDTAGVWLASKAFAAGRYARQSKYKGIAEAGRTVTAAAGWMRRHPRMTAAYAAYSGYAMVAGGDQPVAIG